MNYSFFLFTQLYNSIIGIQYEYDLMFDDIGILYKDYLASSFNDNNKPVYECIESYLIKEEPNVRKSCEERGLCQLIEKIQL